MYYFPIKYRIIEKLHCQRMNTINIDITNLIYKMLPITDQARTHHIFQEPLPSQFKISKDLLSSKDVKGIHGLVKRAMTTGEFEPSVQVMMTIAEHIFSTDILEEYEQEIRNDFNSYEDVQRVDRLINCINHIIT